MVVGINEKTFEAMGGPRARREILSAALDQIAEAKPKLVAIDVILHDPGDPVEDARLEASLRATPNLILPSEVVDGQWEDPLPRFAPVDPSHLGLVELPMDRLDGVTRQIPLERIAAHQHRWALSLVAASVALGKPIVTSSASDDVQVGDLTIPVPKGSEGRPLLIRYLPVDKINRIPVIPVQDVAQHRAEIHGKAVFLGETAQSATRDRLVNPYGENVVGVVANAQAFETLIHGDYLTRARDYSVLLVSLGIAVAAGLIFGLLSGWPAYLAAAALLGFAHYAAGAVVPSQHRVSLRRPGGDSVAVHCGRGHLSALLRAAAVATNRIREIALPAGDPLGRARNAHAADGDSRLQRDHDPLLAAREKRNQLSEMINSESKRLARMIQTFLDVERLADGQMDLKREPFEAAEMVDTCMQRVMPLAERKQIGMTPGERRGRTS